MRIFAMLKILKFRYFLFFFISIFFVFTITANQSLSSSAFNGFTINVKPSDIKYLGSKYSAYRIGSKWGFYNNTYNTITTLPVYDKIENCLMYSSYYCVLQAGHWGIVDADDGTIITPPIWDDIFRLSQYTFGVEKDGLYGWIDYVSGEVLQEPAYDYIDPLSINNYPDLICVCKNNLCGLADEDDGRLIKPVKYDAIFFDLYDDSYFLMEKNGKYYVMDLLDVPITKTSYSKIYRLNYYAIFVEENKHKGIVRMRDGKEIARPVYDKVDSMQEPGFFKVKLNGKWGAIDYDGNLVFDCKYGPLEINRLVRNYPDNQKYKDMVDYNYYYSLYLDAYHSIKFFSEPRVKSIKLYCEKILSNENKSEELKIKAKELIKKYNISI